MKWADATYFDIVELTLYEQTKTALLTVRELTAKPIFSQFLLTYSFDTLHHGIYDARGNAEVVLH